MECQPSDSKKVFKVFDATKRKRTRRKHETLDDTKSIATDESAGACQENCRHVASAKASLQNITCQDDDGDKDLCKRDRDSSPSIKGSRSPRRHRRIGREGISLALKAGLVSTPRSTSPLQDGDGAIGSVPHDQDSFIYAFLEEAIKRDKKKHRHGKKREERSCRDRDASITRDHRHHRRHHDNMSYKEPEKSKKSPSPSPIDQAALFETFAKLCAQMNERTAQYVTPQQVNRSQSHKSLQCEVISKPNYDIEQRPVKLASREQSKDCLSPTRIRSHDDCRSRLRSRDYVTPMDDRNDTCDYCTPYEKSRSRYASRQNVTVHNEDDRYQDYPLRTNPTRSYIDGYHKPRPAQANRSDYREYEERERRQYDDRRRFEQKASRSFESHREVIPDERTCRRTGRSDDVKYRMYAYRDNRDRKYEERGTREKYEDKDQRNYSNMQNKEHRYKRNLENFERASVASKDDYYRERDKYSEKERDSGLSVADGETSTISGRSNCLRVVKQEISEQREAMDKMMKLWKELMKCFKGISQVQDKAGNDSAANVRESAAAQLRLWRECMRRYETVARDVGDTDARLMEEINKQRSEMAEMANMWQECLQRYRDMSNDFNNLKQQLVPTESPTRMQPPPPVCSEGEGIPPSAPYRLPAAYPGPPVHTAAVPPNPAYMTGNGLRAHASAPPAPPPWWWAERPPQPRRCSSPDSRASNERRRRRDKDRERERDRDRDRDEPRYKEKAKAGGARPDHRHRKR